MKERNLHQPVDDIKSWLLLAAWELEWSTERHS